MALINNRYLCRNTYLLTNTFSLSFSYISRFENFFHKHVFASLSLMFLNEKKEKGFFWHQQNLTFLLPFSEKGRDLRNIGIFTSLSHLKNKIISFLSNFLPMFLKRKKRKKTEKHFEMRNIGTDYVKIVQVPYVSLMFLVYFSNDFTIFLLCFSFLIGKFALCFSYVSPSFLIWEILGIFSCEGPRGGIFQKSQFWLALIGATFL